MSFLSRLLRRREDWRTFFGLGADGLDLMGATDECLLLTRFC
jgi:hypothetical protein